MKKLLLIIPFLLLAKDFTFCATCHNGRKEVDLNTLSKKEIKKRLKELKSSKNVMSYIAKKLTKKDIEDITKIYGK